MLKRAVKTGIARLGLESVLNDSKGEDWELDKDVRWTQRLLSGHLKAKRNHEDTTRALLELTSAEKFGAKLPSKVLFGMVRTLQSAGLFEGSWFIYERGLRHRLREAERLSGLPRLRGLALSSVARCDLDLAKEVLAQRSFVHRSPDASSFEDLFDYLAIWSGSFHKNGFGIEFAPADNAFAHAVSRQNVLFFGPGPGAALPKKSLFDFAAISQTMMRTGPGAEVNRRTFEQNLTAWYVAGSTGGWLASLAPGEWNRIFESVPFLVSKVAMPLSRKPTHPKFLRVAQGYKVMAPGHPNMAQVAVLDLLRFQPRAVYLTGVSFYIGGYDSSQRRWSNVTGSPVDEYGSDQKAYEMTSAIASHSPVPNRHILKNLWKHNMIRGDQKFEESIALSDQHYLRNLDTDYGRDAR